jgi:NADP-dependent 3-hydroxy acid dehydrogenase YdfG
MSEERTIAVTGASRGIGAAIAIELAGRGFRVACLTRAARGRRANSRLRSLGDWCRGEKLARLVAAIFTEDIPFLSGETIYIDGGQGVAH